MRVVADLHKADAAQVKSQLDLSLVPEGDEVTQRVLVIGAVCMRLRFVSQLISIPFLVKMCLVQTRVMFQLLRFFNSCFFTRPLLLQCLVTAMGVPDLAELALGFLDGSSRPSDRVAMQTDDGHPAAAAAAARS